MDLGLFSGIGIELVKLSSKKLSNNSKILSVLKKLGISRSNKEILPQYMHIL